MYARVYVGTCFTGSFTGSMVEQEIEVATFGIE